MSNKTNKHIGVYGSGDSSGSGYGYGTGYGDGYGYGSVNSHTVSRRRS
jgi:hypothetical protein